MVRLPLLAVAVLIVGIIDQSARAGGVLEFSADSIERPDFSASAVKITIEPDRRTASVTAERVDIAGQTFSTLTAKCEELTFDSQVVACANGSLIAMESPLGPLNLANLQWRYSKADGGLVASADSGLFDGQIQASVDYLDGTWQLSGQLQGVSMAALATAGYLMDGTWSSGRLDGSFSVSPDGEAYAVSLERATLTEIGFDNPDGTLAAADMGLTGSGRVVLNLESSITDFDIQLEPVSGEALLADLYLNFANAQPAIALAGRLSPDTVTLDRFSIADENAIEAAGALAWDWDGGVRDLDVEVSSVQFPAAYDRYFSSILESRGLGTFDLVGRVRGNVAMTGTRLDRMTLSVDEVSVSGDKIPVAIEDLDGLVDYAASGESADSTLRWQSAQFFRIPLGGSSMRFYLGADSLALLDPLSIIAFDGGLELETLAIDDLLNPERVIEFEAVIEPISLKSLTKAFEWPELAGTIGGRIPRVNYANGELRIGGAVDLQIFDGEMTIDNIRLERMFGVLPTLAADIVADNLDLGRITGAFSFGDIQGRLDGKVQNLRLLDWQPVAFDLDFHTPPDDQSRHRISQRAVENLSSIGGGPGRILSNTFLRFFDDFRYAELGLSCRLENNLCLMGGVGRTDTGGFYIVRGSGVPRIDVIGFSSRVDFPQLLRRLSAAIESGGPTVN